MFRAKKFDDGWIIVDAYDCAEPDAHVYPRNNVGRKACRAEAKRRNEELRKWKLEPAADAPHLDNLGTSPD